MSLVKMGGGSFAMRFATKINRKNLNDKKPEKSLKRILAKNSGRSNSGHITMRHQGGRRKRFLRIIDWKRDKNLKGKVVSLEYDPNRSANIALINYPDGEKRYIIAPEGLNINETVEQGSGAEIKVGNALLLSEIPLGTIIHNVEMLPGKGAQLVRSAGSSAILSSKEGGYAQIKFPSGEVRKINLKCMATIGAVGNADWKNIVWGKAGRMRNRGIRPTVRGVAQNPRSHPHGGGEGRSGIGMPSPKSPWGKKTLGKKTRKSFKYSNKMIIQKKK